MLTRKLHKLIIYAIWQPENKAVTEINVAIKIRFIYLFPKNLINLKRATTITVKNNSNP